MGVFGTSSSSTLTTNIPDYQVISNYTWSTATTDKRGSYDGVFLVRDYAGAETNAISDVNSPILLFSFFVLLAAYAGRMKRY